MEDLYQGAYNADSNSPIYEDIRAKMERIDTELHKVHKKKKNKGKKDGKKKLKKRLKELKMQHKKLKRSLKDFALQQNMVRQKPVWWQEALTKSLPKLTDLGTVILNNATQPRSQVRLAKSQLYLTDGSDRKLID